MKRSDQDRLLREVFANENLDRLRAASLATGLGALRQRRRRRTILATTASLALMLTAFLVIQRRAARPEAAEEKISHVKFIDDAQLLALFPGRSVALIGVPGEQKLIFLDAPDPVPPLVGP